MKLLKTIPLFLFIGLSTLTLNAQWVEKSSGITGGHVNAFLSDGSNLFAGTINGVYLSINDGISWTAVNAGMTDTRVRSLAISGANLFAATDVGIFLSTNNGTSWIAINNGLTNTNVFALAFSGSNLFAGTAGGGVFLSSNNGATWTAINTGLTNLNIASLAVNGGNVFAGTLFGGGAVFISSNNGVSWTNTGLAGGGIYDLEVSGGNLFAGSFGGGVSLTTDNGVSWTTVNTGLSSLSVSELQATGSNLLAATEAGVFLSTNNGSIWTAVNNGLTQRSTTALAVSGGNLVAGTPGGGVFLSNNNGASWAASNSGLTNAMVAALVSDGSNLFAGAYSGVFLSSNNGTNWTQLNVGLTDTRVYALAVIGSNLFAGTDGGGIFLSNDNGASWAAVNGGLTNTRIRSLTSIGSNLFAGTFGGGVFVSNNNGTSWSSINTGLSNLTVYTLFSSGGNLFAGTFNGCFLSTNNGASWTAVNTGMTTLQIRSLGVSGSNIFAGTDGGGVFLSTNNGTSWAAVNTGLSVLGRYVYALKVTGSNVIAGTLDRIYVSTDNGSTWASASTGLPNKLVLALAENGTNVFSGMEGRNVWARPQSEMGITSNPTITSFAPNSGPIGTTVTITGTNFSTTPANNIVYFGATRATVTGATATQLTVTVPTGATYQPITVQVAGLSAYSSKPFVVTFAGGGNIDDCSFAPAVTIAPVNTQFLNRPAFADIDEDGKPDIIIPESLNNQFSIFRNISFTGIVTAGSFAAPVSFATGNQPLGVAVGDLDGDGKRDLAVLNWTAAKVSVYKNLSTAGAISLASKVDFDIPNFAHDISIADIDGDGIQDLVLTSSFNGLTVLRNTGTPGVINASTFAAGINFTTGSNPQQFVLGDLDGDGKLDAAVSNSGANTISLLRNISTPGVASFVTHVLLTTSDGAFSTVLGDIDGDNTLDLIVSNITANTYSLIRNTSTVGTFSFDPKYDLASIAGGNTATVGDFDGDGKIDLATNYGSTSIAVYKNLATSGIINASSFSSPLTFPRLASSVLLNGDVDGDGRNEIITTGFTLQVFRNVIGTISSPTITSFTPSSGPIGTSVTITGTNFSTSFSNTVEFNGVPATITASTATSLTVTVPVGATTGPIEVTIGCNTVNAGNFSIGEVPTIISFNPPADQVGATVVISGTNFDPIAASNTIRFNSVDAATPSAASATSLTVILPVGATTGPISVTTLFGTGTSATNFVVTCTPPSPPSAFDISRCGNGIVTLSATGAIGTQEYRWYDVAGGGTSLSSLANFTTPSLPITTSYYVSIIDVATSCESNRTPVDAIVNTSPAAPIGIDNNGCTGTSISVSATGGSPGQYRWYTAATGGTHDAVQTNDTYATPTLTLTASFFVSINDGTCESTRTEVIATVIPLPTAPGVQPVNPVCPGSNVTLTATGGTDGAYRWYDGTNLLPAEVNHELTITNLVTSKTYHVSIYNGTCESTRTSITVTTKMCTAPVISPTTTTAFIEGSVSVDLCSLITDAENDLDISTILASGSLTSGAPFTISNCTLTINYNGVPFPGTDVLTIEACDFTGLCTTQNISIVLGGEITVYNAISPNGDGRNDEFYIQYIDILPEAKNNTVQIFNRWGDLVWKAENYNNTERVFTGATSDGKELPSGTYFYKLSFAGNSKNGFINLKR